MGMRHIFSVPSSKQASPYKSISHPSQPKYYNRCTRISLVPNHISCFPHKRNIHTSIWWKKCPFCMHRIWLHYRWVRIRGKARTFPFLCSKTYPTHTISCRCSHWSIIGDLCRCICLDLDCIPFFRDQGIGCIIRDRANNEFRKDRLSIYHPSWSDLKAGTMCNNVEFNSNACH